jgi:MFS superfamily sulfate permease-like transporter
MLNTWKSDLKSSFVVFLVALPLCLGIALASNAPLASGLYAGIIGGLVVGFFSGSPISISGPAAGLTVIVASSIASLGSFEAFTLAVFISGIFQIIFSLLKGGTIGDYFPSSVIKGMLAAIGILLILKQIPHAVGYDTDYIGDESFFLASGENTFSQILIALRAFHLGAVVITLISVAILLSWQDAAARNIKFFQVIPGALIAVIASVSLNYIFGQTLPELVIQQSHLVSIPFSGGVSDFFGGIKFPIWGLVTNPRIYGVAFTIAVVGSLQTLLSVDAAA